MPSLEIDSGQDGWDILYRPEKREVVVHNWKHKKIITYNPFPYQDEEKNITETTINPSEKFKYPKENNDLQRGSKRTRPEDTRKNGNWSDIF